MPNQPPDQPQTGRVLHLADRTAWASAQLPAVMAAVYDDVPADDLVLLVVDLPAVAARGIEVRWENLDGGTEPHPHLYGPIPVDAVAAALPRAHDDDGARGLPDLAGRGGARPGQARSGPVRPGRLPARPTPRRRARTARSSPSRSRRPGPPWPSPRAPRRRQG